MKYLKLIIYIVLIAILITSCRERKKMGTKDLLNITQTKWITDANYQSSPWNSKMMPVLLNFKDNTVSFNFSNTFIKYEIIDNKIYLDGICRFNIPKYTKSELLLENNETVRRYIPLKRGKFNDKNKFDFEKILESKNWNFKDHKTKFHDFMLSIYDKNDDFIKGGIYSISLYNQNLIMLLNIDGSTERELYIIDKYDEKCIELNKQNNDDNFTKVIIN